MLQCVDITFAEPEHVAKVTPENCFNSTQPSQQIGFEQIYTSTSSPAPHNVVINVWTSIFAPLLLVFALWATWM
jgi:hypothetical protein